MKYLISFCVLLLMGLAPSALSAQQVEAKPTLKKVETVEFEVKGVCKMCKKRIENAALIKGVKMAEWDKMKQKLKVVYNTKKTTIEKIHEAVAEVGHDTELVKADDKVYAKLPGCCAYRDGVKVH